MALVGRGFFGCVQSWLAWLYGDQNSEGDMVEGDTTANANLVYHVLSVASVSFNGFDLLTLERVCKRLQSRIVCESNWIWKQYCRDEDLVASSFYVSNTDDTLWRALWVSKMRNRYPVRVMLSKIERAITKLRNSLISEDEIEAAQRKWNVAYPEAFKEFIKRTSFQANSTHPWLGVKTAHETQRGLFYDAGLYLTTPHTHPSL
jgi:hypothetical protein